MKIAAFTAALTCLVGLAAGCLATKGKSAYPEQYRVFRDTANQACKDFDKAADAGHRREAIAALRRLLNAKPPPDLQRRWEIWTADVRRILTASEEIADRAEASLTDGAIELGLDECLE
jgi:hypothetical protein